MPKFMCMLAALFALAFGGVAEAAVIKRGHRGPKVERVQRALGLNPVDGVFGPATKRAVKRFQRRHGLTPDGVVGPATKAALGISRAHAATGVRVLELIAECESGANPRAVSPDGRYRGKYQFTRATWRALGGKGDPARASEAEQDRRARDLFDREGSKPWPACARAARAS